MEGLSSHENNQDLQPDHGGADQHEEPVFENAFEDVECVIVLSATMSPVNQVLHREPVEGGEVTYLYIFQICIQTYVLKTSVATSLGL